MKKQWKLDNKGMTLLEVIVAFAIFAIAATILITGFNGALKVMGNSEAIKDASQKNASGLDVSGTTFEQMEGLKDITSVTKDENTVLTFDGYKISGTLITATTAKTNDEMEMSLKMFEPNTEGLVTPTVPTPEPTADPNIVPKVEIPNKGGEKGNGYYTPDSDINDSFMDEAGRIKDEVFANTEWWKGAYVKKYGVLEKGVVTTTLKPQYDVTHNAANSYLQQLYLVNNPPVEFANVNSGGIEFAVKFLYLGDKDINSNENIKITVNATYQNPTDTPFLNTFKLNSYSNDSDTILYLAQDLVLSTNVTCYTNPEKAPKFKDRTIKKGFYLVPNGTDILESAINDTIYNELNSYRRNYAEIKSLLDSLGVKIIQ